MGSGAGPGRPWWLTAGLLCAGLYAVHAGAVHMMFAYRLYVPFLPLAALALLAPGPSARPGPPLPAMGALLALQVGLGLHMWGTAVNATPASLLRSAGVEHRLTRIGFENSGLPVRRYRAWTLDAWGALAADIRADSTFQALAGPDGARRPRLATFVGGLIPYRLPEADAWDSLLSYRHVCRRPIIGAMDYVVAGFDIDEGEAARRARFEGAGWPWRLVARRRSRIDDGREVVYEVYAHPGPPAPFPLPPRTDGDCPG